MSALQRLYEAMEPLRIYALHTDSLVDKELAAYGAGFAMVERMLGQILQQAFVHTAAGEDLDRHERLVGLCSRSSLESEARRELVLYRMGKACADFTKAGMEAAIRALGMEAELVEDVPGETLEVRCLTLLDGTLDLDRVKAGMLSVLPAHLEIRFNIGELTWDMLEDTGIDWNGWDAPNFTWTEFDLSGHTIFKENMGGERKERTIVCQAPTKPATWR